MRYIGYELRLESIKLLKALVGLLQFDSALGDALFERLDNADSVQGNRNHVADANENTSIRFAEWLLTANPQQANRLLLDDQWKKANRLDLAYKFCTKEI